MAQATRSQFTEAMKADMYAYSEEAMESLPTVHDKIFLVKDAKGAYDKQTSLIGVDSLREKPETEKIVFSSPMEGWSPVITYKTYANGLEISMETQMDSEDKIPNMIAKLAAGWTEMYVDGKEEFAADFFNKGGLTAGNSIFNNSKTGVVDDASGDLVYDSFPFFNLVGNERPLTPGGANSYYNGLALSLSDTNLEIAYLRATSTNNVSSRGKKKAMRPDILVVPSALSFTADRILKSTNVIGSGNNDINTMQNILQKVEWQYLTDTNAWAIGKSKKGLEFHNRMGLTFDFWYDETTKAYLASAMARFGAAVTDWRYWVGSNWDAS